MNAAAIEFTGAVESLVKISDPTVRHLGRSLDGWIEIKIDALKFPVYVAPEHSIFCKSLSIGGQVTLRISIGQTAGTDIPEGKAVS